MRTRIKTNCYSLIEFNLNKHAKLTKIDDLRLQKLINSAKWNVKIFLNPWKLTGEKRENSFKLRPNFQN
jgi:hypothetical protein